MKTPQAAQLVMVSYADDVYGVGQKSEASKLVYGYTDSVSASEVFEGGRNGLNPELRFIMTDLDYSGERILILGGVRYSIYRTYPTGKGYIELYCERKGGTN